MNVAIRCRFCNGNGHLDEFTCPCFGQGTFEKSVCPERLSPKGELRLELYATEQGFPVQRKAVEGSALGKFSLTTKTITLSDDLEPLQELKVLTHELAHALMHRDINPLSSKRNVCELEAESCAFILCHSLGLDTSRYGSLSTIGPMTRLNFYWLLRKLLE